MHNDKDWITARELDYLAGLGSHRVQRPSMRRLYLLRNYIRASKLRHDWGEIDKGIVIDAAKRMLAREMRNG